jgi:imidazole glycerol-phosphate synthase subunit HisF
LTPRRIIPLFLLRGQRLVKGTQFRDFVDVGDPLSQAMIYDAQGAEEIVMVDIDASRRGGLIDPDAITHMIRQCRLPIGAGGGIRTVADALRCFEAGADKIVVNTGAVLDPALVPALAAEFGAQSVVVSLDVRRESGAGGDAWAVYVESGTRRTEVALATLLPRLVEDGAGEIILTSIDREGTLSGFDRALYALARPLVTVPLVASGGAGTYDHLVGIFRDADCDAAAIGKMLFLRDYDIVRIKSYLTGRHVLVREA